jgi:very-short-patch-repair endonuclease
MMLQKRKKYLWYVLRCKNLGVKFRRQAAIGRYIVDFVCFEKRLVVEVDGGQHGENQPDKVRDGWLEKEGFEVLRFWNHEVLGNRESVVEKIIDQLKIPLPRPPHKGEGIPVETRCKTKDK